MKRIRKTLYLCGAGNLEGVHLALSVKRARNLWERIVLLDDDPAKSGTFVLGVQVLGPFALLKEVDAGTSEIANLVTRSSVKRWLAWGKLRQYALPFASLIHPNVDTFGARLGEGVTAYQNSILGPDSLVSDGSVVMVGAVAGHGSLLGRCCIVAPNAVVNARVRVGEGTYIGTGAAIMPEVKVGEWATIGSCSAVISDVPTGATVMGVPSKIVVTLAQKLSADNDEQLPSEVRCAMKARMDQAAGETVPGDPPEGQASIQPPRRASMLHLPSHPILRKGSP